MDTIDKLEQCEHKWRVKDIITNKVIICICKDCEKEAEFKLILFTNN